MPGKVDSKVKKDIKKRVDDALKNDDVPRIHFNGFVNSAGTGDVMIVLESNNRPVAILNGSFTVVKTLADKLSTLIVNIEQKSGNKIMTTEDVQRILEKGGSNHEH